MNRELAVKAPEWKIKNAIALATIQNKLERFAIATNF